jgi:hypothetical protein
MISRKKTLVRMRNEDNKIWEAAVLALLKGVIYEAHR